MYAFIYKYIANRIIRDRYVRLHIQHTNVRCTVHVRLLAGIGSVEIFDHIRHFVFVSVDQYGAN
jgi:hypothetical protein